MLNDLLQFPMHFSNLYFEFLRSNCSWLKEAKMKYASHRVLNSSYNFLLTLIVTLCLIFRDHSFKVLIFSAFGILFILQQFITVVLCKRPDQVDLFIQMLSVFFCFASNEFPNAKIVLLQNFSFYPNPYTMYYFFYKKIIFYSSKIMLTSFYPKYSE